MRRLRLLIGAIPLLTAVSAMADIVWLEKEYDFGTWSEDEGLREGAARFVNTGDKPVFIKRVRPSCGCTGVKWTETSIEPGDTAVVEFNYNPEGRPGPFEKSIKVYVDDADKPDIIRIRGTVIGQERSLRHRYPVVCGPLRMTERIINFGEVPYGDMRQHFITCYNTSPQPLTPSLSHPKATDSTLPVDVRITPTTVKPGELQTISIYLNSRHAPQMGSLETTETICVGDSCIDIQIHGYIVPPKGTPSADAPQSNISTSVIELKGLRRDKKCKVEFSIANTGKSLLEVKRIYSQMPELEIKKYPTRIKAGKEGKVEAYIDLAKINGQVVSGIIEIITNDPLQPIQNVRFAGRIED